jgi:hypothetical protein
MEKLPQELIVVFIIAALVVAFIIWFLEVINKNEDPLHISCKL